jgi:hypothetical protein
MHETLIEGVKLHIDSVLSDGEETYLSGWCVSPEGVENVRLKKDKSIFNGVYGKERPDVKEYYNNKKFHKSGFSITIPKKFKDKKNISLEILRKEKWTEAVKISGEEASSMALPKTADNVFKISKRKTSSLVVVDNFYENPDEVRDFALSCDFQANESYHKGSRTGERYLTEEIKDSFEKHLQKKITGWEEHGANGVFQYCVAGDSLVYHIDSQSYAAMVYLTPDAPPSCGTTMYKSRRTGLRASPTEEDEKKLGKCGGELHYEIFKNNFYDKTDLDVVDIAGNVYNRLVIFDAQTIHAASEYFGDTKENSRLFHIFFFDVK